MEQKAKDRASLIDFLRSIKFSRAEHPVANEASCSTHFAHFEQRARTRRQYNTEDSVLIRSAN